MPEDTRLYCLAGRLINQFPANSGSAPQLFEQFKTFAPLSETAIGIDVTAIADMHNTAAPGVSQMLCVLRRTVRVVAADHNGAAKRQRLCGRKRITRNVIGPIWSVPIGHCHQQRRFHRRMRPGCPMRNGQTAEAMRHQNDLRPGLFYSRFQPRHPFVANRLVPIALLHAHKTGIRFFPEGLPVMRAGVAEAGEDEDG